MTDARFPERWLNDRRIRLASAAAFRQYVAALAWSVANRTDGVITKADLPLVPFTDRLTTDELVDLGLWQRDGDHWLIADFDKSQTSREQLEAAEEARRKARDKKRRQRAEAAAKAAVVPRDVPGDNTRPGQARTGT